VTGTLFDQLVEKPQRETAGSVTASRFDYQKNWAFCHMIERHCAGGEYLVAFEFHDDVLFLNSETAPDSAEFFQVKTSSSAKARTAASILKKSSGKNSIVGKMILNSQGLTAGLTVRLILVSNNAFEFCDDSICAVDMEEKHKTKFLAKLKDEFPGATDDILQKLHFRVSAIPIAEIETFLRGRAVNLFEQRFGPNVTHNVVSWIRLVQGEIARRNNYPSTEITSVADLIAKKCIGRSLVAQTLDSVEAMHSNAPNLDWISATLKQGGWSDAQIMKLNKAFPRAVADYQNPTNDECLMIRRRIANHLKSLDVNATPIAQIMDGTYTELSKDANLPSPYASKDYLSALTILVYNEGL
jgi:hypothetical protein